MANKEKKLEHIQVKDNGIKLSNKVGDVLNDAKQILQKNLFEGLLKSSNETNLLRYKIAQNIAFKEYSINSRKTIEKAQKEVKTTLKEDSSVNLKPNQVARMSKEINKGLLFLQQDAEKAYQNTLKSVLLNVKAASDLKEQLAKHIESGLNLGVVYKDGKNYKFDSYFEMKARTDIQQDIGKNMIAAGQEAGVIFYIASFYGDCAPDHVEMQQKGIFYDDRWEAMVTDEKLRSQISDYIKSKDLMSIQDAMDEKGKWFTTRPNCRHYFQYIDIDSVLGAKTPDDVKNLRQERDLNFNGKYKPDKYEALQQQRLNERKIRDYKADMVKQQQQLTIDPEDKYARSRLESDKANIRNYQKAQRDLEKQYSNIERRYDREKVGNRIDFGGNLTTPEKNTIINNKLEPIIIEDSSMDKIGKELKEIYVSTVKENIKKYPQVERYLKMHKLNILGDETKAKASASGNLSRDNPFSEMSISFNPKYGTIKSIEDSIEREVKSGFCMPCDKEHYKVYDEMHELGHVISYIKVKEYIEKDKQKWLDAYEKDTADIYNVMTKHRQRYINNVVQKMTHEIISIAKEANPNIKPNRLISGYARQSQDYNEVFAEIYANSQCGKPNELGLAMLKWLEEKLK